MVPVMTATIVQGFGSFQQSAHNSPTTSNTPTSYLAIFYFISHYGRSTHFQTLAKTGALPFTINVW
jgi:predicted dinucleotide-utilizing enzyme